MAASQPNYAPAKAGDAMTLTEAYNAAKAAMQANAAVSLTSDYDAAKTAMQANAPVVLAADQPNYVPAKVGDKMDLVDSPNANAVQAIQSGLATVASIFANTVDGVAFSSVLECLLAAVAGEATVDASNAAAPVVRFLKQDGTTVKLTVTMGETSGARTATVIA
jgi:hypothetical protein